MLIGKVIQTYNFMSIKPGTVTILTPFSVLTDERPTDSESDSDGGAAQLSLRWEALISVGCKVHTYILYGYIE